MVTLNSIDERICDLVVVRWISPVKMSFLFIYWNITLVDSAALCYWPLRFYCQNYLLFKTLIIWNQEVRSAWPSSHSRISEYWQAQKGFSGIVLFSKAVWEDWAVQKVRGKTMWMHAQISWIPTPVLKPHCVSGYVLVCQTWNLVTKLGIRLGDSYRFFFSSS